MDNVSTFFDGTYCLRSDDMLLFIAIEMSDSLDGNIVRLSRATREDDLTRIGSNQTSDLLLYKEGDKFILNRNHFIH